PSCAFIPLVMTIDDKHGHTMLLNTSNGHTDLIEIGLLYRLFQHPLLLSTVEIQLAWFGGQRWHSDEE
ncbi:MAG: hypothetical protein WA869_02105, partial [Alloacidobacterium sp.]